jgi:hypothetical protein
MIVAEPLGSAEENSGEIFTNWHAVGPPFGNPRVAMAKRRPRISAICCARYQKLRWTKLTISSVSFKRCGESCRPMAIALNATLRNTRN